MLDAEEKRRREGSELMIKANMVREMENLRGKYAEMLRIQANNESVLGDLRKRVQTLGEERNSLKAKLVEVANS